MLMSIHRSVVLAATAVFMLGGISACENGVDPVPSLPERESGISFSTDVADGARASYIVRLRGPASDVEANAHKVMSKTRGKLGRTFHYAIRGFSANLTRGEAAALAAEPDVEAIEREQVFVPQGDKPGSTKGAGKPAAGTDSSSVTIQNRAPWNLDRIDQASLPLDKAYSFTANGAGVHVYIIDSGIWTTHAEFKGRATADFSAIDDGYGATDCVGHGTHVAGIVGGVTAGVAKGVRLHSIRVLDCNNAGTTSQVVAGIDWMIAILIAPAVANIIIGGPRSDMFNQAVERAIAVGITVVVAAGNQRTDACNYSPSSAANAITVGATTSTDQIAGFSNFGPCVDIFAPGESISSASFGTNKSLITMSGTSMSSPHVAGAAALLLQQNASATPEAILSALVGQAVPGVVVGLDSETPNMLIQVR